MHDVLFPLYQYSLCCALTVKYETLDLGFLQEVKRDKTCSVRQDFDVDASF